MIEILKAIFLGIVEGITEWLPVSSTGHMILVDQFLQLNASEAFKKVFFVVIQFGAILAVLTIYWRRFVPLKQSKHGRTVADPMVFRLWLKIIIACIPAAVVGLLFDDQLNALFYNFQTVGMALIVFGIAFIAVENRNAGQTARAMVVNQITYKDAFIIGMFQLIAAIFPGTSRSGATILGGSRVHVLPRGAGHVRRESAQVHQAGLWLHRLRVASARNRHGRGVLRIARVHPLPDGLCQAPQLQSVRLVPHRARRTRARVLGVYADCGVTLSAR